MYKNGSEGRVKGKYIVSALCVLGAFLILVASADAQTIEGNREVIDTPRVYINAPHLIFPWSDAAEYQFMSKEFSGDIDFMVGFDSELIRPKSAELLRNGDWIDVSSAFNSIDYDYEGMNKWYYTQGVSIVQDTTYRFRINYDFIGHGSGKYWVCAKPSAQTLQQAISAGNFLCLDPLWNGTYAYRIAHYGNLSVLTGDTKGYIPVIQYINGSKELYACLWTVNQTNQTIGYTYYNNWTDYVCIDKDESSAVTTVVIEGNSTSYFGNDINGLIAWWSMKCDATTCFDESPFGNDGTKTGTPPFDIPNMYIGNAQNFTGVRNQGIEVLGDTNIDIGTGENFSATMWIHPQASVEAYESIIKLNNANFDMFIAGSQQLYSTIWNDTNSRQEVSTANSIITYGNDYHIVFTYNADSDLGYFYLNTSDVTNSRTNLAGARDLTGLTSIGYYSGGTVAFKDGIDELRLYNKTMTDDEIKLDFYASHFIFTNGSIEIGEPETAISDILMDYTIQYCYDDDYLYVRERGTNQSGFFFDEYLQFCEYGCSNETFMNLGRPGCKESDMEMALITVFIMIGVFSLIAWVVKK